MMNTTTTATNKIEWTPKKVASLEPVKKIADLPFEVSIVLGLHDNGYSILSTTPGAFGEVIIKGYCPAISRKEKKAMKVVCIHNHPSFKSIDENSRVCCPSPVDILTYKTIRFQTRLRGFSFYDSIIVSRDNNYFSFRENKF